MKSMFMLAMFALTTIVSAGDFLPNNPGDVITYENSYDEALRLQGVIDEDGYWSKYDNLFGLTNQWAWSHPSTTEVYLYDGKFAELLFDSSAAVGTRFYISTVAGADYAEITDKGVYKSNSGPFDTITLTFGGADLRAIWIKSVTFAKGVGVLSYSTLSPVDSLMEHTALSALIDGRSLDLTPAPKFKSSRVSCDFNQLASTLGERTSCGVKFTFTNTGDLPYVFNFTSGKYFDIELLDAGGKLLRKWSDGRFFTQALWSKTVEPGESWTLGDYIEMAYADGHPLETGDFIIRITMAGHSAQAVYSVTLK